MGIASCWRCPHCFLELPWTQEKEIESHDCFTWLDDGDLFYLDDTNYGTLYDGTEENGERNA